MATSAQVWRSAGCCGGASPAGSTRQRKPRLLDDLAFYLRGREAGVHGATAAARARAGWDDMVRLARVARAHPGRAQGRARRLAVRAACERPSAAGDPRHARLDAVGLGRIGARAPLYGSAHGVVPPEIAAAWLDALLALDWKRDRRAAAAARNLARLSDDRARDLPPELRERSPRASKPIMLRRGGSLACATWWRSTKPANAACSARPCPRA